MGKSAGEVREEIGETRHEMERTIDEIAERTSPRRVLERRRQRFADRWRSVRESVMGTAQDASSAVGNCTQSLAGSVQGQASNVVDTARTAPQQMAQQTQGNPIAAGVIAFGGGLLLASLLPPTEMEQRAAGKLREQSQPLQNELVQAGRQVADEVEDSARQGAEQVKQRASEASGAVKEDARSSAQTVKETAEDETARSR
jgi:vacuolar-type H+-ATPase subunit D/Vma8